MSDPTIKTREEVLAAVRNLSLQDRAALFQTLEIEFDLNTAQEADVVGPTEEDFREFDARLKRYQDNPESASSWDDVLQEVEAKYGPVT